MGLIKVYIHCLIRIFAGKKHNICSISVGYRLPRFYCSCGYNNGNLTLDHMKTLANIMGNKDVKIRNISKLLNTNFVKN